MTRYVEDINTFLRYEPESGNFYWKVRVSIRRQAGSRAGSISSFGYVTIVIGRRGYRAHRLAWLLMTGKMPEYEIDHKDGNRANNKWENLREATRGQNRMNSCIQTNNKSTGYKNVYKTRYSHVVRMGANGKSFCKSFKVLEEAINYAKGLRRQLHGEFAKD